MKRLMRTTDPIEKLEEALAGVGMKESFFLAPDDQCRVYSYRLKMVGIVKDETRAFIEACDKLGYQRRFAFNYFADLLICVSVPVAQRRAHVQRILEGLDPQIEKLDNGKLHYLHFDVHPQDFRYRSIFSRSPRLLRGPTYDLVRGLRQRNLRVKVVNNQSNDDVVIAYTRNFD